MYVRMYVCLLVSCTYSCTYMCYVCTHVCTYVFITIHLKTTCILIHILVLYVCTAHNIYCTYVCTVYTFVIYTHLAVFLSSSHGLLVPRLSKFSDILIQCTDTEVVCALCLYAYRSTYVRMFMCVHIYYAPRTPYVGLTRKKHGRHTLAQILFSSEN